MKSSRTIEQLIEQASVLQSTGRTVEALQLLKEAKKSGAKRREICNVFLAHVLNELGEQNEPGTSNGIVENLADNAQKLRERTSALRSSLAEDHAAHEEAVLIDTEIGLLQHEIQLSVERGQFNHTSQGASSPLTLEELNQDWLRGISSAAVSQLGQDLWVLERCQYKRGGFFVEFGATNGIMLSNSWLLEKKFGWNGICAEPNPKFFEQLKRNRLCTLSDACIGAVTGEKVDFLFADVYGGMVSDLDHDQHKDTRETYLHERGSITLETISLHDFLIENDAPKTIDYISVDTEGSEFSILETFPFEEWDIRHITVEHNYTEQRAKIHSLLESHGFCCREAKWDDWYYREGS